MTGASSWRGGAKTTFLPCSAIPALAPFLPNLLSAFIPPLPWLHYCQERGSLESGVCSIHREAFGLVWFVSLSLFYLLVSMSPEFIYVVLEGALRARIFSRLAFLLLTEAAAGAVMGGECSPSAGLSLDANTSITEPSLSLWCLS